MVSPVGLNSGQELDPSGYLLRVGRRTWGGGKRIFRRKDRGFVGVKAEQKASLLRKSDNLRMVAGGGLLRALWALRTCRRKVLETPTWLNSNKKDITPTLLFYSGNQDIWGDRRGIFQNVSTALETSLTTHVL